MSRPFWIVITGFMGSGKTTVADELARITGRYVAKLDQLVEFKAACTVKEIFEQHGERHFRLLETQELNNILNERNEGILSLGGGAWILERNRCLIAQYLCFTVWLDAPFDLCWRRLSGVTETPRLVRPLARSKQQAQALFNERRAFYQLARFHLETNETKTPEDLAYVILRAIKEHLPRRGAQHHGIED